MAGLQLVKAAWGRMKQLEKMKTSLRIKPTNNAETTKK